MPVTPTQEQTPTTVKTADKLFLENTLLRVSGALFCHDARRATRRTKAIRLNDGVKDKTIVIRPDPELGQPGPLAHKVFVALIKKHSDYGRPTPKDISFTRREIGRLIGRKHWGGHDSERLSRALHEIHHTFITAHFRNGAGRQVEHSFNIFPEIRVERRELASDPIEACTVTLAEPIIASLRDEHFTCLNHALMARLGTIGQALYLRLFFHFANLYDGRNASRLALPKRYDDICAEWLGGLTVLAHRSRIIGEQLGPHLEALIAEGILAGYALTRAKTGGGFVLTFRPGRMFFADYDRFYRHRAQGGLQFDLHDDRRAIGDPLKVAYLFAEKRSGQKVASIAFVPSKDVQTAKQLLAELPMADIGAFIDYGLAQARVTNFDVQTLGGLKQYLADFLRDRDVRKVKDAMVSAQAARNTAETERAAYEAHRAREALALFATLRREEQNVIRAEAEAKTAHFGGALRPRMTEHTIAKFVAERHGGKLTAFADWQSRRAA